MQKTVIKEGNESPPTERPGPEQPKFVPNSSVTNPIQFDIPTVFVKLPSGGAIYGPDSSLYQRKELEIRAMTTKDEDILTSRTLVKKNIVIQRLLQNVIVDKSVNVDELTRGDREAILMSLRITGCGENYDASVVCNKCGESFTHKFDLSRLEIKPLIIEPLYPDSNMFEFTLPVSKKKVIWKYITTEEENQISELQKKRKTKLQTDDDNQVTTRLFYSIISIDGIEVRQQIASAIRNMPARDSIALRTYMDDHEPGVDMSEEIVCPSCLEESTVDIPMTVQFFWPNLRR